MITCYIKRSKVSSTASSSPASTSTQLKLKRETDSEVLRKTRFSKHTQYLSSTSAPPLSVSSPPPQSSSHSCLKPPPFSHQFGPEQCLRRIRVCAESADSLADRSVLTLETASQYFQGHSYREQTLQPHWNQGKKVCHTLLHLFSTRDVYTVCVDEVLDADPIWWVTESALPCSTAICTVV